MFSRTTSEAPTLGIVYLKRQGARRTSALDVSHCQERWPSEWIASTAMRSHGPFPLLLHNAAWFAIPGGLRVATICGRSPDRYVVASLQVPPTDPMHASNDSSPSEALGVTAWVSTGLGALRLDCVCPVQAATVRRPRARCRPTPRFRTFASCPTGGHERKNTNSDSDSDSGLWPIPASAQPSSVHRIAGPVHKPPTRRPPPGSE